MEEGTQLVADIVVCIEGQLLHGERGETDHCRLEIDIGRFSLLFV